MPQQRKRSSPQPKPPRKVSNRGGKVDTESNQKTRSAKSGAGSKSGTKNPSKKTVSSSQKTRKTGTKGKTSKNSI